MVDALPDEQVKYMTDKIPMKRCGTLKEVVDMITFIVVTRQTVLQRLHIRSVWWRATTKCYEAIPVLIKKYTQ
jgi:hypothetical protein